MRLPLLPILWDTRKMQKTKALGDWPGGRALVLGPRNSYL